jgi:hypothetical protein
VREGNFFAVDSAVKGLSGLRSDPSACDKALENGCHGGGALKELHQSKNKQFDCHK